MPAGRDPEVAYAGVWAQARWRHDRRPTQAELFAILAINRDGDDQVLLASGGTAAGAAIMPMIERCWGPICAVAGKICASGHVRHRDVLEALGSSSDGPTAALQLSHIRSGSVPGSFTVTRPVAV